MQRWQTVVACTAAVIVGATGCNMEFKPRGWKPTPLPQATPVPVAAGELAVSARPAYRLIASPGLADVPSRLIVVQVRANSGDERLLHLAPEYVTLILPTGESRPAFDHSRAMELLRRTTLAEADMSYVQTASYVPGGVDDAIQPELNAVVTGNLLSDTAFTGGYVVQGFVVIDTGVALASLAGSSLDVVAYRMSDDVPARGIYAFPGGAVTATPTETPIPAAPAAEPVPTATYEPAPVEPASPAPATYETAPEAPAATPVEAVPTAVEPVATPVEAVPSPVEAAPSPVEAAPSPMEAAPSPVEVPPTVVEAAPPTAEAAPTETPASADGQSGPPGRR